VLVDQGPPEADVARQLRGLGVRHLAAIVLTHPERDHVGGAEDILRRLAVDRVLDPRLAVSGPFERAALSEAADRGVPVVETRAGDGFRLGRLRLRALWPDSAGTASENPNRIAIVLLASYGEVDALLTADAETDVTARLLSHRIEILKVAHHGSADPGLLDELRELRPAVAVISCGRDNEYGHPTPSTLAALRDSPGLSLYRTDEDGRVVLESDGRRISVRSER
jgi:competence protein ComEC